MIYMSRASRLLAVTWIITLTMFFAVITRQYELWFWYGLTNFVGGSLFGQWWFGTKSKETSSKLPCAAPSTTGHSTGTFKDCSRREDGTDE